MDLYAFIGASHGNLAGVQLRHRRLQCRLHALIFHPRCTHREQPGRIDFGRHVRQLPLDRLELTDRFPELPPLPRIIQRRFISSLRHSQPQRRDGYAPAIENPHRVDEPVAFFAQQVFQRNLAVFEDELRRVAGAQAELVLFLARLESLCSFFDDESRKAVRMGCLVGHRNYHHNVGVMPVRAEGLRAVQHPLVALADRRAARAPCIGSRARLRQPPRANELPRCQLGDVLAFLLLASSHKNMIAAQGRMRRYDDAHRPVYARELLDRNYVLDVAHTRAAVFAREDDPHQPELAELLHRLAGKMRRFIPLHYIRQDLARGEIAHGFAQVLLLV